jgi:hypothetical protein
MLVDVIIVGINHAMWSWRVRARMCGVRVVSVKNVARVCAVCIRVCLGLLGSIESVVRVRAGA